MLDLSPHTEALARRLADAEGAAVDEVVRAALEARQSVIPKEKDRSPAAVAARIAAMERIVEEMKKLPVLDPRPIQEIVDDLNAI